MLSFVDATAAQSELPEGALELKQWLIGMLEPAPPGTMAKAVRDVEIIASQRFPQKLVTYLLRQILSEELVGHD